jgi:hypothetical protein
MSISALILASVPAHAQSLPTALGYTGASFIRSAGNQQVSATLTDSDGNPLSGRNVSFALNGFTSFGTTDQNGIAMANFDFDPEQPTGAAQLQVSFAGDSGFQASIAAAGVEVFQSQNFVIWGGNSVPLQIGSYVNFWGHSWADQVIGGQFGANPSFKGFANNVVIAPLQTCQSSATTSTLTTGCWQTKPGNSFPPAVLPNTIEVIVSTTIVKSGSNIFGNISQCAIVQVDQSVGYAPDPGHPGFGTIVSFEPNCSQGGGQT